MEYMNEYEAEKRADPLFPKESRYGYQIYALNRVLQEQLREEREYEALTDSEKAHRAALNNDWGKDAPVRPSSKRETEENKDQAMDID